MRLSVAVLAQFQRQVQQVGKTPSRMRARSSTGYLLDPFDHDAHRRLGTRYSITSSARPISGFGTVIPKAAAVLRLIVSLILVSCCTGISAGFSPLRTRPA